MKVWHDDVRKPPDDSWHWARTNETAQAYLRSGMVEEVSLDHDLGLEDVDPGFPDAAMLQGSSPNGDGYDLVQWMIDNDCVPPVVKVHSWNSVGAARMATRLNDCGFDVTLSPFRVA